VNQGISLVGNFVRPAGRTCRSHLLIENETIISNENGKIKFTNPLIIANHGLLKVIPI